LKKQRQYQVANRAHYHPVQKRKYPPKQHTSTGAVIHGNFFQGNLAQNMRFGGKDHDLSGFVQRTVVMKDRFGNIQIAKEKQFFNSSKNAMRLRIKDDEKV
jgi:hypothetical protein